MIKLKKHSIFIQFAESDMVLDDVTDFRMVNGQVFMIEAGHRTYYIPITRMLFIVK